MGGILVSHEEPLLIIVVKTLKDCCQDEIGVDSIFSPFQSAVVSNIDKFKPGELFDQLLINSCYYF